MRPASTRSKSARSSARQDPAYVTISASRRPIPPCARCRGPCRARRNRKTTMYRYDEFDARVVAERVEQFRGQVERRLAGELNEDQFKPLRLRNGLYLQLHAYMLRIAIPYGSLNPTQLRKLAWISRTYDKGFGHFTTRTNLQLHWIKLKDAPDILDHLASVDLHAIQTSGNTIRN